MKTGLAFSMEVINSHPIPTVESYLFPWIIKDKEEALNGAYVKDHTGKIAHDGNGLEKAKQVLRQAQNALKGETDSKAVEFLKEQLAIAESKVLFYTGKIYILEKILEKRT